MGRTRAGARFGPQKKMRMLSDNIQEHLDILEEYHVQRSLGFSYVKALLRSKRLGAFDGDGMIGGRDGGSVIRDTMEYYAGKDNPTAYGWAAEMRDLLTEYHEKFGRA